MSSARWARKWMPWRPISRRKEGVDALHAATRGRVVDALLANAGHGQAKKDDPADVARVGFDAMMNGEGDVVAGWKNKIQATIANVTPSGVLAEMHRRQTEPGSGQKDE